MKRNIYEAFDLSEASGKVNINICSFGNDLFPILLPHTNVQPVHPRDEGNG
jgi:hypothetical protein